MPYFKHFISLLLTLLSLQLFAENNENQTLLNDSLNLTFPVQQTLKDSVINYGKLFLNTPYHYGSSGSESFDCSGFTSYIYKNFGYGLKRSSSDQAEQFPRISKTELKPGDLVFFEGHRHNGRVGHVGIVVAARENGEFDFIHASTKYGVIITNSQEPYYLKRYVKAGRVIGSDTTSRIARPDTTTSKKVYISSVPAQKVRRIIPAVYHKVKKGENLSTIAEKYNIGLSVLKRMNKLKSSDIKPNQKLLIKEEESYEEVIALNESRKENTISEYKSKNDTVTASKPKSTPEIHEVRKGETLSSIAHDYKVSIDVLKSLNNLQNGKIFIGQELKLSGIETLSENTLVKENVKAPINTTQKRHKVKNGESLFSIAKDFNVSVNDLKKWNNLNDSKLSVGQLISISEKEEIISGNTELQKPDFSTLKEEKSAKNTTSESIRHKVKTGESLFSIAKEYNVSVNDLKEWNNLSDSKLLPDQSLIVKNNTYSDKNLKNIDVTFKMHEVKSGESLISIAKTYNTTVSELKSRNNLSSDGIQTGQKLKVPVNSFSVESDSKNSAQIHTVKTGESLFSIAKLYNCSVKNLKDWNNLSKDQINIGDKIKINH